MPAPNRDAAWVVDDYDGEPGNAAHITRNARGLLPVERVAHLAGAYGERPGEHRTRDEARWQEFLSDIAAHGIREPIFITVDPGRVPVISEGNHRRDAALELGLTEVPVLVRYFGHAERDDTLLAAHDDRYADQYTTRDGRAELP